MTVAYMLESRVPELPLPETIVYVHPGRTVTGANGDSYTSVVGSGVVVCVWDPVRGIGGMSHFLLPDSGNAPPAQRFGDVALKSLVEQIGNLGGEVRRLRARVYGGNAPPIAEGGMHLGDRNVQAALAFLSANTILIMHRDLGGKIARKVVFNPRQGTAEMTYIGG